MGVGHPARLRFRLTSFAREHHRRIASESATCRLPITGSGKQGGFNDCSEVFPRLGPAAPQLELVTTTTGIVPAMMPKKVWGQAPTPLLGKAIRTQRWVLAKRTDQAYAAVITPSAQEVT
jgi:hypothetical protein